jgi:16S rRNA (cytosine967-C5)-methyltransferase
VPFAETPVGGAASLEHEAVPSFEASTRAESAKQVTSGALPRDFDAALVDVPCSNTGVIARRPEARLGLTRQKLASLTRLQIRLLQQAADCVRPEGRCIYSTCSIEPAENEAIVAEFLRRNPEWAMDEEKTTLPSWGARLCNWRDGGYVARLRRR